MTFAQAKRTLLSEPILAAKEQGQVTEKSVSKVCISTRNLFALGKIRRRLKLSS